MEKNTYPVCTAEYYDTHYFKLIVNNLLIAEKKLKDMNKIFLSNIVKEIRLTITISKPSDTVLFIDEIQKLKNTIDDMTNDILFCESIGKKEMKSITKTIRLTAYYESNFTNTYLTDTYAIKHTQWEDDGKGTYTMMEF